MCALMCRAGWMCRPRQYTAGTGWRMCTPTFSGMPQQP